MEEVLISFQTARLAKEKGFNKRQVNFYNSHGQLAKSEEEFFVPRYEASTQTVLHKWMIEKHGMYIMVIPTITSDWTYKMITVISERDNDYIAGIKSASDLPPYDEVCGQDFRTYEEALEHGMQQALK